MKTRETKQRDLQGLTESLQAAKSAMVVSFTGLSVSKDQEFRNTLRSAGAKYQVVKNTLARRAVKDTQFEQAADSFKGVTAIAWTDSDPVVLSKAMSKFMKDNADIYTFKMGVVDGKLIDLKQLTTIANLPSKEELISKLLFVLNAQAQRIVTVINAVPRDLAVVIKQIGEKAPATEAMAETPEMAAEAKTEEAAPSAADEPKAEETAPTGTEVAGPASDEAAPAAGEEAPAVATEEAAPAAEAEAVTPVEEKPAVE